MTAPILPSDVDSFSVEPSIVNPLVDHLLHLDRPDRKRWLREVGRGLDAFPSVGNRNRRALLRGIVVHDTIDRIVLRLYTRFPKLAIIVARLIPITGPVGAIARVEPARPIVLALMHFGPILFVYTIVARTFRGRTIYALHAGGENAEKAATYLRRVGVVPLVNDERALRFLAVKMVEEPNCVLAFGFDYLGRRSRLRIPFLGGFVAPSRGLAYLAELTDATVFTAFGAWGFRGPRAVLGDPLRVDFGTPDSATRQRDLMLRLFAALETQVRRSPHVWSEWRNAGGPKSEDGER